MTLESLPLLHQPKMELPKRRGRVLLWAALITGFCGLIAWIEWSDWPNPSPDPLPAKADIIVVLGGGHVERPNQALRLYQEGRAVRIIVTGDGGSIFTSLLRQGVPESVLVHETKATSTVENAEKVKPLLEGLHVKTAILVTTWSHAQRSKKVFQRVIPDVEFFCSFEKRPQVLSPWEVAGQWRERLAAIYYFIAHGIWCF